MKIYALVVTKDEASRYLEAVLRWTSDIVDELVVFDDGSTDDTVAIARGVGAIVGERAPSTPSFIENESSVREAAWRFLEESCGPTREDYVACIDADEFLLTISDDPVRVALERTINFAESESRRVIDLPVAEIFEMADSRPLIRNDGQWGQIRAARIARWASAPRFKNVKLAGGSLPQMASPPLRAGDPVLLHAGYRRRADRIAKQNRYARRGHGGAHVRSISEYGIYTPWPHPLPPQIAAALEEDA